MVSTILLVTNSLIKWMYLDMLSISISKTCMKFLDKFLKDIQYRNFILRNHENNANDILVNNVPTNPIREVLARCQFGCI